jgi:Family of unknown function (DUF5338)
MKELASLLKAKYGNNSARGKRAQIRNEILIRRNEILAELTNGWSVRAIWEVLYENKEITCSYKTFAGHVRRLQAKAPASDNAKKRRKEVRLGSNNTKQGGINLRNEYGALDTAG